MTDDEAAAITVSRVLDATPERVWQVIAEPRSAPHWWGPRGCIATVQKMDLRPGGEWQFAMNAYGLATFQNRSVFTEVVEHRRIVYTNGAGRQGRSMSDFESSLILEPEDDGSRTGMTIRVAFATAFFRDQFARKYKAVQGGEQTLDRLAGYLAETAAGAG
nr:SRPBCC domain-containing protein [uncultured Rhodopila sp.]